MNKINNKACREDLEKNYQESLENVEFKKLIKTLKIDAETAKLNNSSLMDCVQELGNCAKCKGLFECQNKVMGHFIYPKKDNLILDFGYYPCKYHLEQEKLQKLHKTAKTELEEANFKSIDVHDKNRIKVIKWLTEFFDNYDYAKNL